MRDRYGFNIPDIQYVIGFDPETKSNVMYTVTDRIYGESLSDKKFQPEEILSARETLDSLLANMCQYFSDVYKNGGDFKFDLANLKQFVWGRRKGDKTDKLWMVDVGPDLMASDANHVKWRETVISTCYGIMRNEYGAQTGILRILPVIEDRLGVKLEKTRSKVLEFINFALTNKELMPNDFIQATLTQTKTKIESPAPVAMAA